MLSASWRKKTKQGIFDDRPRALSSLLDSACLELPSPLCFRSFPVPLLQRLLLCREFSHLCTCIYIIMYSAKSTLCGRALYKSVIIIIIIIIIRSWARQTTPKFCKSINPSYVVFRAVLYFSILPPLSSPPLFNFRSPQCLPCLKSFWDLSLSLHYVKKVLRERPLSLHLTPRPPTVLFS